MNDSVEEEKGLMLWGGVDLDATVQNIPQKRCACGAPAVMATRRLDQQERTFACAAHRRVA
jgi:hypothetical protein